MTAPLLGHPISTGDRTLGAFDHTGPRSYQTGGETVQAGDVGMSTIDFVHLAAYSQSGNYIVLAFYPLSSNVGYVTLAWYQVSTGIQPPPGTDLSAEHIRMEVIGA